MTYFIDQYLDLMLRDLRLCPGADIDISYHSDSHDICVSIFWHSPSVNLGWYPICQIDVDDQTIYHREGSENPDLWEKFVADAADYFCRNW